MKTAWILNHYAVLPSETGSTRHFEIAARLAKKNWSCVIFAASFSHWEKKQRETGSNYFSDQVEDNFRFRFVHTPSYDKSGFLRMLNMLVYFVLLLFPWTTKDLDKPDVIIGSSVHPLAAWAAQILATRYKVPFIFEIRDLWPQTLIAMGRIEQNSIQAKLMCWLENRLYQRAEKIITLMPDANLYISRYGIQPDKIEWIPNGVAINEGVSAICEKEQFTIMYVGAHGKANALDVILDAIKIMQGKGEGENIYFRFVGEGDCKTELISKSRNIGLKNIKFEDGVAKSEVFDLMSTADAFIISVKKLPDLYKYGVSMNKTYDYMLAGRPVIIAIDASNNPVAEAEAGFCVSPESAEELATAILKLSKLPKDEQFRLGMNGRDYIEKFHSFDHLAEKFEILLNEIA